MSLARTLRARRSSEADAGNRTRITYPDTKTVDYEYDAANQLTSVTDWLTNETTYAYDDAGRLTTTTYPNGVTDTRTYDDADRLLTVTNAKTGTGTFSSFTYTLDAVGNRDQVVANNGTTTYDYDDLYRLTEVVYPGPTTHTYTYDAQGNRLTKNTDDYTYNDGDRMTDVEGVSYAYDNNGNQTSRGASDTFTFDHENRMTQSVVGGVTSSSVYYGDGLRKSHTVNGTTTNYKYDVLAGLPVVIQDGTYTYVYGLDLISMTDGSGNQKYFSYDGLGSVTDITNGSGTVTDTFVYDAFGAVTARTGSTATVWKFTGEQADDGTGDSGYYYLRARHYDSAIGRFIGRDKVQFSQRYVYADSNPALYVDPNGLCRNPASGKSRSLLQRTADAFDCVGDATTTGSKAVAAAAVHCAQDFNWLPEIGDCGARFTEAVLGAGLVVAGTGIAVGGCAASIAIVGPATAGVVGAAGCGLFAFAGATVAVGGGVMFVNAFLPHEDHASETYYRSMGYRLTGGKE